MADLAITPSGLEIDFTWQPKRQYRVRQQFRGGAVDWDTDWQVVPSVTDVLGCLDKSAGLVWWGQGVGAEGVLELNRRGVLIFSLDGRLVHKDGTPATKESVVALLTAEKISVNHARDKAGDRGKAVHDALEVWAKTGDLPDPTIFPFEQHGYVVGLCKFLRDVNPEPVAAEVMVGSLEHGFAGRYDLRLNVPEECEVVFHRTPKRGPQYARLKPGVLLADLKTSKGVYATHHLQLAAYEGASLECGYEPTVAQGILHVSAEGEYEFVRSKAVFADFLAIKGAYDAIRRLK